MKFPWKKKQPEKKPSPPLDVVVIDRSEALAEYAVVATSDMTPGMFEGTLKKWMLADVVVIREGEKLTILKCRSADDVIERLRG